MRWFLTLNYAMRCKPLTWCFLLFKVVLCDLSYADVCDLDIPFSNDGEKDIQVLSFAFFFPMLDNLQRTGISLCRILLSGTAVAHLDMR